MQLYLDSFGAYLYVRNGMLGVRTRAGGERLFALRDVSAVLLTKGTALSSDAALLAAEHDIPLLLIDAQTHRPLAQLGTGLPGNIATVRKNQPLFSRAPEGFQWVASVIAQKVARQRALLQTLAEWPNAPHAYAADLRVTDRIMAAAEKNFVAWTPPPTWDAETAAAQAEKFRGQEGTASRVYFQQLARLLEGRMDFANRQKRPAYDPFNAVLNYLYGMLYTSVHLSQLKSGLDPYLGILHADRHGDAPTLVFDAIEPYRPWADEVALRLAWSGDLAEDCFEPDNQERGLWLASAGKDLVIDAMLQFMETSLPHAGRQVRRKVLLDLDMQQLALRVKALA